jgi:hypothetical protein
MLILQREVAKHKSHETADPFATSQSATNRRIAISAFPFGLSAFSLNIDCLLLLFRKQAQIEFLPS